MNPKARITYRFDDKSRTGGGRPAQEPPASRAAEDRKVVPLYPEEMQFTRDVAPWNSPFQDDPYALEKLIRETDGYPIEHDAAKHGNGAMAGNGHERRIDGHPFAYTSEPEPAVPEPVRMAPPAPKAPEAVPLGEAERVADAKREALESPPARGFAAPAMPQGKHDPVPGPHVEEDEPAAEGPYTGYLVPRRRTGPSWLKVFASVAGALVTGALFGYVLLSLFADQAPAPAANGVGGNETPAAVGIDATTQGATGSGGAPAETGSGGAGQQAGDAAALLGVELPARHYAMLQYGVFSSVEAMETAIAELKGKGYASAADKMDGFRVYAGIAPDKTEAAALGEQLDVPELFVKTVEIPAVSELGYAGKAEEAIRFMDATDAFVRTAGDLSASMLGAGSPAPFANVESDSWKEAFRKWNEAAAAVEQGTVAEHRDDYAQLSQAIRGAAASLEAYEAGVSRAHLWQAQAQLMEAVFAWKEWMGRF